MKYHDIKENSKNQWLNLLTLWRILQLKAKRQIKKPKATTSTVIFFPLYDISRFPVRSQQCVLVPTHIFRPSNTGNVDRTGGTICSFSTKTWGLWMKRKKDTQYPKSLSQGHHVKNSPSFPPPVAPSFPLLFFSFLIKPSGVVRSFETRTPSHVKS